MKPDRSDRWVDRLSLLLAMLTVVFIAQFAWRYADERLYADSGYYLLRTILGGGFHIEHSRWVLLVAEFPAVIGIITGASLPALIQLHSLANVLFIVAMSILTAFVLKDHRALIMLALSQLIGLAHGLFCPVFELYFGVGFLILFHSVLSGEAISGRRRTLFATVMLIGVLFSHPMAWLLFAGSLLLIPFERWRPLRWSIALTMAAVVVVRILDPSAYETAQFGFLQRLAFPSLVFGLFAPHHLWEQLQRVLVHYPDVLVLAIFCGTALWRNGDKRGAFTLGGGLLVLFILTGLYLPEALHDRYREQVDYAYTAWLLLVLMTRLWPVRAWRPALLLLLLPCIGFRMYLAERTSTLYTARTQWHLDQIATARDRGQAKAIIDLGTTTFGTVEDHVSPYWSTGVESLLLSAKEGADRTVSIITVDDAACTVAEERIDVIVIRCPDVVAHADINADYFDPGNEQYAPLR